MNAWAQQGTREGAMRAQQILDRLEGMPSNLQPTVHSYATVIHGWAQSKGGTEAAQQAERVLEGLLHARNERISPDTVVFNAVIDAWSSSGDPRAGTKALSIVNRMKELSSTRGYNCEPDIVTYNTVSNEIGKLWCPRCYPHYCVGLKKVLSAWSHSGHINASSKSEVRQHHQ